MNANNNLKHSKTTDIFDFELSIEAIEFSKRIYGKIIKCIIAPYHLTNDLTDLIDINKPNQYIFPEHNIKNCDIHKFIYKQRKNKSDLFIITANPFIIRDVVSLCTRKLNKKGEIVKLSKELLLCDLMSIQEEITNYHYTTESNYGRHINSIIDKIKNRNNNEISDAELDLIKKDISYIGDSFLKHSVLEFLN